ncbi:Uncharacterised protein [Kluyvera cryocrescens]|uniref:Uncharacterized protein n=1 Tax=Kluyvera cryocrescens TaxID=580 RepID=A0A485CD76_KLUCR|nr:Uncharacterised protein [Kluyvera cryocrescens]
MIQTVGQSAGEKQNDRRPGYQGIEAAAIPAVALPDNSGSLRVIAGRYQQTAGPLTPSRRMNVWDMQIAQDKEFTFEQPEGWSTAIVVLEGTVTVNGATRAQGSTADRAESARKTRASSCQHRRQSAWYWRANLFMSRLWAMALRDE